MQAKIVDFVRNHLGTRTYRLTSAVTSTSGKRLWALTLIDKPYTRDQSSESVIKYRCEN
jgi:hypothetical protein